VPAEESSVFKVPCSHEDSMHTPRAIPTTVAMEAPHQRERSLEHSDRVGYLSPGADAVFLVDATPHRSLMPGTHACRDVPSPIHAAGALRFIPSAFSWLQGIWPNWTMHEYHAPAQSAAIAHTRARSDMHAPIYVVLWHMLRDCRELLVDAFSFRNLKSSMLMHGHHACRHVPSNEEADSRGFIDCAVDNQGQSHSLTLDASGREARVGASSNTAERRSIRIAVILAVLNQISASTSIINYAPVLLKDVGVSSSEVAMELASAVGTFKMIGIILGVHSHFPCIQGVSQICISSSILL
jgi:hypothetical protein